MLSRVTVAKYPGQHVNRHVEHTPADIREAI